MTRVRLSNRNAEIFAGREDLSVWSDEELRRGYRRDKNGGWTGRKPKVVPMELYQELARRQYDTAANTLRDSLQDAVALFRELVLDPKVDAGIRLKAAQTIVDRVMGRAPLNVEVQVQPKWIEVMASSLVAIPIDVESSEAGYD